MKILMTTAALAALALVAPAHAQLAGATAGANPSATLTGGATGNQPAKLGGIGTTADMPVNGSAAVNPPMPGASNPARPPVGPLGTGHAVNDTANLNPGAIKDGRTLATGQDVNASAKVQDNSVALKGGMSITDMGGQTLGKVLSVSKDKAGRISSVVIQTTDGVRRTIGASNLSVKGGMAVTTQSEADLQNLPAIR